MSETENLWKCHRCKKEFQKSELVVVKEITSKGEFIQWLNYCKDCNEIEILSSLYDD